MRMHLMLYKDIVSHKFKCYMIVTPLKLTCNEKGSRTLCPNQDRRLKEELNLLPPDTIFNNIIYIIT